MTWQLALHELRRSSAGLTYWLLLAAGQLIIAVLLFAQLEGFARIGPQLTAAGSQLNATDLIIALQGEGDVVAVMQFLNELQSPQYLTLLDEATMQLKSGSGGGALYKLDLNIRCFSDTLGGRDDE